LLDLSGGATDRRPRVAMDQANAFAATRADLSDPAQARRVGDDESNGNARERLAKILAEHLNRDEVGSLLETLEGHGSVGPRPQGPGFNLDAFRHALRGRGLSEDQIKRAYDALGIGESTKFGGVFGGNMGGNLREQIAQPSTNPTDPAARDRSTMTHEESAGLEPCRDSRTIGGRDSMSFDEAFGLYGPGGVFESQPRHRRSERELAMDSAGRDSFQKMFPEAARIGLSEHDFSANRRR
jgi:hypothetical protein